MTNMHLYDLHNRNYIYSLFQKDFLLKKLILKSVKMKSRTRPKKYASDLAVLFRTKSIFIPNGITNLVRQRRD